MRTILHSDLNAFYASVEALYRPELRNVPMAVAGDVEARHGIILTKNQLAKGYGVQTGEPIWQARQKCPGLVTVPPDMDKYVRFSRWMREIYADYTDRVEPFGMDEAWLDVSGDDGEKVAGEIRARAREELGITASIGVADNKIFAKLGSDMRKPDATTVITPGNYREKVWPLPVGDLLYVGPATKQKLFKFHIRTIGDLAAYNPDLLRGTLGKSADMLHAFANGQDRTPVACIGDEPPPKSIGNSTTMSRDAVCDDDARWVLMMLAETVGNRLREAGFKAAEVQVSMRDCEMFWFERQTHLKQATDLDGEIYGAAIALFRESYGWMRPIRSLGLRVGKLTLAGTPQQISLFDDPQREKQRKLQAAIDTLRGRFGDDCVRRGFLFQDMGLSARPNLDYKPFESVRQQGG